MKIEITDKESALAYVFQLLEDVETKFNINIEKREVEDGWSVGIPCQTEGVLDYLYQLEEELANIGIGFDTGYYFKDRRRDWELDFSFYYDKKL